VLERKSGGKSGDYLRSGKAKIDSEPEGWRTELRQAPKGAIYNGRFGIALSDAPLELWRANVKILLVDDNPMCWGCCRQAPLGDGEVRSRPTAAMVVKAVDDLPM